jgi:hypothetical protein
VINHPGDPEWDRPPANLKKITVYGMTVEIFIKFTSHDF